MWPEIAPSDPMDGSTPGTYFIGSADHSGLVKIGRSGDVYGRLADLQTGSPVTLELWGLIYGFDVEAPLHAQLQGSRRHREWFDVSYPKVRHIVERWIKLVADDSATSPEAVEWIRRNQSARERKLDDRATLADVIAARRTKSAREQYRAERGWRRVRREDRAARREARRAAFPYPAGHVMANGALCYCEGSHIPVNDLTAC